MSADAPAPASPVAPEAPPECARHPTVLATASCPRCGRFACAACLREEQGQALCLDCLARPQVRLEPSPRAKLALWLSLLGLHGVLVFLPAGLWLAREERKAIDAGAAPSAGRPWVEGARLASMAGVVAWAVLGMVLFLRAR
jgi:hypothetical protein